jgi:hyperosmotically inducible protein
MNNHRLIFSLLVSQAAIVSVASPALAQDKRVTDDYITDSIRNKLAADQVVKGGDLDVQVKDGAVVLSGRVHEARQKEKAAKIAKGVRGVKSVVNNIKVEVL